MGAATDVTISADNPPLEAEPSLRRRPHTKPLRRAARVVRFAHAIVASVSLFDSWSRWNLNSSDPKSQASVPKLSQAPNSKPIILNQ